MLCHRQGAVRCFSEAAFNRGTGRYSRTTRQITTPRFARHGLRVKRLHAEDSSRLIQCLVSRRSTKPVHVRAICRRYAFRAAPGTSLASCIKSDAKRRQSRSSRSNCSDFDIAHRLESPKVSVARSGVCCRWPTPHKKTKSLLREDPTTCGVVEYACKEKAPRRGGALQRALHTHPPDQHAEVRFDLRLSSRTISDVSNREFDLRYAASLHCAFTSFDALLRWTCWSTWSTHPTGMRWCLPSGASLLVSLILSLPSR
jgi:hypothetical protein